MTDSDLDVASLIALHADEADEDALSHAYELGRRAMARGLGILDIMSLRETTYRQLVLNAPAEQQGHLADAVESFFREMLSPFEMSFRGYRDANRELKRLNQDLQGAYSELQAKQVQLIQSAKMASLGELVAGIAHELNNPLAFVVSHLDTVQRDLAQVRAQIPDELIAASLHNWKRAGSRLEEMGSGLTRIRDLVAKLRTFSRLDEGEQKVVSVRECMESMLTILQHRLKDRIAVDASFGEPDALECFPALLTQAMMNLVANAIDAIEGPGTIWISTGADADRFVISIADNGSGIPAGIQGRVLEPFFTTKPVGQGTGLGLSITHSIVQRHAGTLELSPRPGGGTIATIRVPLLAPSRPGNPG